jgi:hypothetical protein
VRPNNGFLCAGGSLQEAACVSLKLSLTDGAAADTWLITQYPCKAPQTFQANFRIAIRYSSVFSLRYQFREKYFFLRVYSVFVYSGSILLSSKGFKPFCSETHEGHYIVATFKAHFRSRVTQSVSSGHCPGGIIC